MKDCWRRGSVFAVAVFWLIGVPEIPCAAEEDEKLDIGIEMDPSVEEPESALWLAYLIARANYIAEHEKEYAGRKGVLEPEFEEEAYAREMVAQVYLELKEDDPDLGVAYFDDLARVLEAGFIREYVWTFLARETWEQPAGLEIEAFGAWRAENLSAHAIATRGAITVGASEEPAEDRR